MYVVFQFPWVVVSIPWNEAVAGVRGTVMVKPNVALTPEEAAVNVTGVEVLTASAVTRKVAEVEPCGTVTDTGTPAAAVLELESATKTPPVPAVSVRVTVPVPDWPLTIVLGLTETLLSVGAGGVTVTANVLVTPE